MSTQDFSVRNPKIDPSKRRPDNTPADNDRFEIGPTPLAFEEWAKAGLTCPDLPRMRQDRLNKLVAGLNQRNLDAVLLFDPISIRYATDTTNMQLWNTHNPFRACMVLANGHIILWEYKGYKFFADYNPLVTEVRKGAAFFFCATGERTDEKAMLFAETIEEILQKHAGTSRRVAVDKIQIAGYRALEAKNIEICDGEELMEHTRAIKTADELNAMRCAVYASEQAIIDMREFVRPGVTEDDVWAELHKGNIRRGGEWIETRILSSGPRTNPWMQECGPRVIGNNEILGFDTDMIGCYGMCSDISRTWFVGDGQPTQRQKDIYKIAHEHLLYNTALVAPGVGFREYVEKVKPLPEKYQDERYGVSIHGVGLCDEWPALPYIYDWKESGINGEFEPNMALCVEAYIGESGGPDGVKLEDQVLVTESGVENITQCPFEDIFLS